MYKVVKKMGIKYIWYLKVVLSQIIANIQTEKGV